MSLASVFGQRDSDVISFTVHEPPNPPADRAERADSLVFVKEGFTYSAALFTPIWLLVKRQWLPFLFYVIVVAIIGGTLSTIGAPPQFYLLASSALHMLIGFEADVIQRWTLGRRGYQMIGSVSGRNEAECERRFFEAWLPGRPLIAPLPSSTPMAGTLAAAAGGLSEAGRTRRWPGFLGRR